MKSLLVVIATALISHASGHSELVVEAPAGKFHGHIVTKTRGGRDVLSFEGIPYAKPPVDSLRFKAPVTMPPLEEKFNATDGSKMCYQPTLNFSLIKDISSYIGQEDCLYLNIHKPKVTDGSDLLPVMVWVHGGGYIFGSGSKYLNGPEFLLDKDMILVTINYRLGILGFLYDPAHGIEGNMGMKDQTMALKWVHENIKSFGGDPNSVTLAGESAGGSSVSAHMHSPLSKGLFHRVIAQSGTTFCPFAVDSQDAAPSPKTIGDNLGCTTTHPKLLKCLQKMSLKELFQQAIDLIPEEQTLTMDFVPVLEEPSSSAFLTSESLNEPSTTPLILGVTSRETMFMLFDLTLGSEKFKGDLDKIKKDVMTLFPIWGRYTHHQHKDDITKKLIDFYFGEKGVDNADTQMLTDAMSDVMFNHGAHKAANTEKGPTYLYKFSYQGEAFKASLDKAYKDLQDGVGHAEDLRYMFKTGFFLPSDDWNTNDLQMSNKFIDMWYNFAKKGDPTPDTKEWTESNSGEKYLDMANDGLKMKTNMFKERMEFLDKLNIDRFSHNVQQ